MYKLGCTTQTITDRFSTEKNLKVIWTKEMLYQDAIELEHIAHNTLTSLRYKGEVKLLKEGTYECFHTNYFPKYRFLLQRIPECLVKDLNLKKQKE